MKNAEERRQKLKQAGEKARGFLRERGLYLVMIACLVMVGVAAMLAWGGAKDEPQQSVGVSGSEDQTLQQAQQAQQVQQAPGTPAPSPTPAPTLVPDFSAQPSAAPIRQPQKASPPVKGEVTWPFAMNELVYSATLEQWMTHAGVDVASPQGTEVFAVFGGTVEQVFEDDALGTTVVIAHSSGRHTVYANLEEDPPVKEGQALNARELVGYVGNTAMAECSDPSHLHFELLENGAPVDPEEHILFEKSLD